MHLKRSYILISLGIIMIMPLILVGVNGDLEPNDEQYLAESIDDGTVSGSLYSTSEDYIDWYVMDIPPFTTVTVTLSLTSPSGWINATSYWDDLEIDGTITLSVHSSAPDEIDVFRSESSFEELWLEVSGSGSYDMKVTFEQELFGGCCGGFILLGGLPLVGGFMFIRYRKGSPWSQDLSS